MKKILHITVGSDEDFIQTDEQLKQIEDHFSTIAKKYNYEVKAFKSSDDKRTSNNPTGVDDYDGPDDVSLSYRQLTDYEKKKNG